MRFFGEACIKVSNSEKRAGRKCIFVVGTEYAATTVHNLFKMENRVSGPAGFSIGFR